MKLFIALICLPVILFANQYEDLISTEKNYQQFSQYHYELNQDFEDEVKYNKAIELRIFTYNAGMLSAPLIAVPVYKQRAPFLIDMISDVDFDILSLQEIWNDSERDALAEFAVNNGYIIYSGSKKYGKKHGLFILINKDIVDGKPTFSEYVYKKQVWYEPLTGYAKSALKVELTLHNGKSLFYLNTHLTAVAKGIRDKQAQELIKTVKPKTDYIIFSGDLNNTTFEEEQVYWPLVQHFKFLDAHLAKFPNESGFTYDPTLNSIARNWGKKQNGRERIDYLLIGRGNKDVRYFIEDSGLLFTEDLPEDGCSIKGELCKLSDHFGVGAWVYLD